MAKKIFIADDESGFVATLKSRLEFEGFEITTAPDGKAALEQIPVEKPDLVLLDIMMPKMSGFEVCKRLKNDPKTRDILVVMVTALNETGDIERAAECGTDDYLSKPIDRKALIDLIRNLLRIAD